MARQYFFPTLAICGAILLLALVPPVSTRATLPPDREVAHSVDDSARDLPVQDHETIRKSFTMSAAQRNSLEIDNVFGSIEVLGDASGQLQLVVEKSFSADSKDSLERARKEVTLDFTQQEGTLKLYVNGPFRCQCQDCDGFHRDPGYVVRMDFQVHVPRDIDVKIKTVNQGRVRVSNVAGNFLVRNVNGDIEMENIAGSGTARTVNGPVHVSFRQNPRENSEFRTVNGNVELRFARDLSADFRFKTFTGAIYSDFSVASLPLHPVSEERHGGKRILRADRYTNVRVNSGGPEIQVENLNGDIRILENHE